MKLAGGLFMMFGVIGLTSLLYGIMLAVAGALPAQFTWHGFLLELLPSLIFLALGIWLYRLKPKEWWGKLP